MIKRHFLLATMFVLLLAVAFWYAMQPKQLVILVVNQSHSPVTTLRIFGGALAHDVLVANIEAGEKHTIALTLAAKGTLKYEISQGFTKVDTFISNDVSQLDDEFLVLTIKVGNQFILSR